MVSLGQGGNRTTRFVEATLRRRRELGELLISVACVDQLAGRRDHEGELLRETIVKIACDAAPLFQYARLGERALVDANLSSRAHEEKQVERESQCISGVHVLGVERWEDEIVHPRESREGTGRAEPEQELVA